MTAERENIPKVIRVPGGFCVSWAGVVLNERFPTHARARDHAESITKAAESWYQSRSKPLVEALKMWIEIEQWAIKHHSYCDSYEFIDGKEMERKPCNCGVEKLRGIAKQALEAHNG